MHERVAPEEAHLPGGRGDEPEQHPQHGRLARAVGPEVAVDVPGLHREVDAAHRDDVVVALDQAAGLDGRGRGHVQRALAAASAAAGGTEPMTV